MTCPICQNRRTITEPSRHSYSPGAWITRPCDCVPIEPEPRGPSSDDLKYATLDARKKLEASTT